MSVAQKSGFERKCFFTGPVRVLEAPEPAKRPDYLPQGEPTGECAHVATQGGVVQVRSGAMPGQRRGGGKRGKCVEFSARSRLNMYQRIRRVDFSRVEKCSFITLTWPPEIYPGWQECGRQLRAFEMRLNRKLWSLGFTSAIGFWKKEPHPNTPERLHYHILLFNAPWISFHWIRDAWTEIIGSERPARVRIEAPSAIKSVGKYLAKYVGKACSGSSSPGFLVPGTYLHGGRWWGVWNSKELPWAEVKEELLERGPWMFEVRRTARKLRAAEMKASKGTREYKRAFRPPSRSRRRRAARDGEVLKRYRPHQELGLGNIGFSCLFNDTGQFWAAVELAQEKYSGRWTEYNPPPENAPF